VPFAGRMSYCLTRCLQMVLAARGDLYPVPYLECVGTEVFGFVYDRATDGDGFAVNGFEYHLAGERMLEALGYDYALRSFADEQAALAALRAQLEVGPVVAGMLDMGYLTYAPDHCWLLGSDHAVVVLGMDEERVVVHDPAGYPATPLPLADFVEAWRRDVYTGKPFGLWIIGARRYAPAREEIYQRALALGLGNLERVPSAAHASIERFGPAALEELADDIESGHAAPMLAKLAHFSFRVSGQRCYDSAAFLDEAPERMANAALRHAADVRRSQALVYGKAQLAAAQGDTRAIALALRELAPLESTFSQALRGGLADAVPQQRTEDAL
jgi:hypothetical protein